MMKKILAIILFSALTLSAQVQRNPVLEYCTGTWCQWCPCGHTIISENILRTYPNAIILGYHGPANGSDPYSSFYGNQILSALGLSSYPTGIVDRSTAVLSRSAWLAGVQGRMNIAPTVEIAISKTFNPTTGEFEARVFVTPLVPLTGNYKVNVILTESELKYAQTGNSSCTGGADYTHNHVVRAMMNGHLGESLNNGLDWFPGETIIKKIDYTIPAGIAPNASHVVVMVTKEASVLRQSEVQQAMEYQLTGQSLPYQIFDFTSDFTTQVDTAGSEIVFNLTVQNTSQDSLKLAFLRTENDIPSDWSTSFCFDNNCFSPDVDSVATTPDFNSTPIAPGEVRELSLHFFTAPDRRDSGKVTLLAKNFGNPYNNAMIHLNAYTEVYVSAKDETVIPTEYSLGQNYPNPFNPESSISFSLPASQYVKITLYDVMGRELMTLAEGTYAAGQHAITVKSENLSSGTYVYRMKAGSFMAAKKMIIAK